MVQVELELLEDKQGSTWNETTTLRIGDCDEELQETNTNWTRWIQFPDDEIRYHDDLTGKHHNTLLGGAVEEEEEQISVHEDILENNDEDLDALATAQEEEEEAEALTSLATTNRTLREARDKQHQVRMSRGNFPQQQSQRDRNNKRPET